MSKCYHEFVKKLFVSFNSNLVFSEDIDIVFWDFHKICNQILVAFLKIDCDCINLFFPDRNHQVFVPATTDGYVQLIVAVEQTSNKLVSTGCHIQCTEALCGLKAEFGNCVWYHGCSF